MKHRFLFAGLISACAVLFAAAGCQDEPAGAPVIDGELAMKYAQGNYDLGPRVFRTEGAAKSAEWIEEQAYTMPGMPETGWNIVTLHHDPIRTVEIVFHQKGRAEDNEDFIVIGAHHDTKKLFSDPDFAGANDGASGVGALLAMVAAVGDYMNSRPLPCGLRFVFFDGEEALYQYTETDGLLGSRDYVEYLRRSGQLEDPATGRRYCKAMILLDMIGDKDLHIALAGNSTPGLAKVVLKAADELGYGPKFSLGDINMLDDHYPFLQAGIPAVDLIDFEFGPKNCYWHTGADTMDKISAESMKTAADVALLTAWRLASNGFKDL
ncbi:MAG: M28 family peptidase [Lentisphaeria bacterium]|nr:M28 family peptidase [Lentisphaeria bacterium]